jgi:uncharacterized coiled-coil protein SlyX
VNQIIALLVKQWKTIARLRAQIDRLNDKVKKKLTKNCTIT